jgi:general secretion pathway protein A
MYLSFYHLKKEPFHITPDPEFLFLSPSHKEALGSVIYGIEKRKGFVAITGEVGVGKTTILRSYLDRAELERLKIIYVFNPNVSFQGLLKTISRELGFTLRADDTYEMVNQLQEILIEMYWRNQFVVLIIDEAQNMPIDTLENLRMLSNLETSKDKLIQILLVGQPEFDRMLRLDELRQLRQRVAIRCKILPLSAKESLAYIRHRLARASHEQAKIFSRSALRRIVKHAKGIPRTLNILCDNALVTGFGYQKKVVSTKIVKEIIADLAGQTRGSWRGLLPSSPAAWFRGGFFGSLRFTNKFRHREDPPAEDDIQSIFGAIKDLGNPPESMTQGQGSRQESALSQRGGLVGAEGRHRDDTSVKWRSSTAPTDMDDPGQDDEDPGPMEEGDSDAVMQRGNIVYRFFTQGGNLNSLVTGVYGFCNEELIEMIRLANPRIRDINHIRIGEIIRFPELDGDAKCSATE